jgi:hypothetical protein
MYGKALMKKTTKKTTTVQQKLSARDDDFQEFDYFGLGKPEELEEIDLSEHKEENMIFKFVEAVSKSKTDLMKNAEIPDEMEKKYNPFITNKAFSFHLDTILHANEMNSKHWLFKDAQFRYYLGALRPRYRKSEWFKAKKDSDLDNIQQVFQCNRTVAKQYMKVLSKENMQIINNKVSKGGDT